jgi:hypothetical protein
MGRFGIRASRHILLALLALVRALRVEGGLAHAHVVQGPLSGWVEPALEAHKVHMGGQV